MAASQTVIDFSIIALPSSCVIKTMNAEEEERSGALRSPNSPPRKSCCGNTRSAEEKQ
jgi:hypothetical protein